MARGPELRRIVGAMTARPWKWSEQHRLEGPPRTEDYGSGPEQVRDTIIETDCGHYPPEEQDREAIATLANHADAFVKLVEACERRRDLECDLPGCSGWHHTMACQKRVSDSDKAIDAALTAVHAIPEKP